MKWTNDKLAEVRRLYQDERQISSQLAAHFGCKLGAIKHCLWSNGITLKDLPVNAKCITCSNMGLKCDGYHPCNHCVKKGHVSCTFESTDGTIKLRHINLDLYNKPVQQSRRGHEDECSKCKKDLYECVRPNPDGPCLRCLTSCGPRDSCCVRLRNDLWKYIRIGYFKVVELDDSTFDIIRDPDVSSKESFYYRAGDIRKNLANHPSKVFNQIRVSGHMG